MRYHALACDYDGTLATDGCVAPSTIAALERALASGRRLVLVSGRELDDLLAVFPHADLFERVVAENGALLYRPARREVRLVCGPPPTQFVEALRKQGIAPLSVGRVIVSTWRPHELAVLETIEALGLELQVIFNKGAVMVLPPGVNKATGLKAALDELGLSPHNCVGIGDAENDHAFLDVCECSVAVANALPMLKERANLVTNGDHGAGVCELIDRLVTGDLKEVEPRLSRDAVLLGTRDDGSEVRLRPYGKTLLISGPSGSGKSTMAIGVLERLSEHGYQFCLIDPEGEYEGFGNAVSLGNGQRPPSAEEVLQLLHTPDDNAVVNLLGLPIADRPAYFAGLMGRIQELRTRTGRPHWIVVDEAHHLVPAELEPTPVALRPASGGLVMVTVHPDMVAPAALSAVDSVFAIGAEPHETIEAFCRVLGQPAPGMTPLELEPNQAFAWFRHTGEAPFRVRLALAETERRRHRRKYAEGDLGPHVSFYFRGRDARLNLRAQNLTLFSQLADGVDEATWLYHLRRGDYSRWFRDAIKDDGLADEAAAVEARADPDAQGSRAAIKAAIERRYTGPA